MPILLLGDESEKFGSATLTQVPSLTIPILKENHMPLEISELSHGA